MTAQTKTTLKTYFEVGDRPTQSQFEDLIDSFATASTYMQNALEATAATAAVSAIAGVPIPVALGGTGGTTAASARTALGLVIGTDVEAVDADIMRSDTTKRITANMGFTPVTDSSSSGSITIDFSTGNISKVTLSENITSITLSGATAGDWLAIVVTQGASSYTVAGWPATVKWALGGTAPTISTTNGAVDIVTMFYDGTNYYASVSQDHR